MLPHLLNATKSLITKHWKSVNPPTVGEWLLRIAKMCLMEEIRIVKLFDFSPFSPSGKGE